MEKLKPRNPLSAKEGYQCLLPIPFVKGSPADFEKMHVEELREFIRFSYSSQYEKPLPAVFRVKNKPPSWWPLRVTFDKNLKIRLEPGETFLSKKDEQNVLSCLVWQFYNALGMTSLLLIAQHLTQSSYKELRLVKVKGKEPWKIVDLYDKAIIYIDFLSRSYDEISEDQRKQAVIKERTQTTTQRTGKRGRPKKSTKRSPLFTKINGKRKLLPDDDDEEVIPVFCQYCNKEFRIKEFCDDHEQQCVQNPATRVTQSAFLAALGLRDPTEPLPETIPTPASAANVEPIPVNASRRSSRKVPKRNQLLNFVKGHPIPLTSARGRKLAKDLGVTADYTYPPKYERACQSTNYRIQYDLRDFPVVTKKAIEKDAENPHIFTLGKRQRVIRNQELVIGLKAPCWKFLNKIKTPRLVLTRVKPPKPTIAKISPGQTNKSYLERRLKLAIENSRVRLNDCVKNPTEEQAKYLERLKTEK